VAARRIEATLCWLHARALDRRRPYLVKHTTRTVKAEIERIDHTIDINALEPREGAQSLAMNDIAQVGIRLYQPLICDSYADNRATGAFIVIDPTDNATVAAGMIV
jgi:sulfate adenylyltransferase subunit 1